MKKLKVLVTASTFPRWKNDNIPGFVKDQIEFLFKNYPNLEIHVLAPHSAGAKKYEEVNGVFIHRFQYFWPSSLQKVVYPAIAPNINANRWLVLQIPFLFFCEVITIYRLLLKLRPSFLYSHWFIPQGICGGIVALLTGVPHVFTSHSSDVQIMRKVPFLGGVIVRFFIDRMEAFTVVSRRSLEKIKSFYTEKTWDAVKNKVEIIPMGVDVRKFAKAPDTQNNLKEKYNLGDKKIIFFIGRLAEKKGVTYLLKAFKSLSTTYFNLVLVIAGDGPLEFSLKQETIELGIEKKVLFLGYINGHKKNDYFHLSDILVIPSIITKDGDAEGLPVVLLEGLAAGKICVATDASGADDILLNEKNGFLVREKNVKQLIFAISSTLKLDDYKKANIAIAAQETAKNLDWNMITVRYYNHFFAHCCK